jgi:protocatechuate 3,4-dioxygenase beta subunit
MPAVEVQHTRVMGRERTREVLTAIREQGGEVASVEIGGVRLDELDRPRVQGTVYDSTRGQPLEGAIVFFVGTEHRTRTDRYGRFALMAPEGDFVLTFAHPRADTVRVRAPDVQVAMRPDVVRQVRLALPTQGTILAQSCADVAAGPVISGLVRDDQGLPVEGARVSLGWPAGPRPDRWRHALSDERGRFVFCGGPPSTEVVVRATHDGFTSETQVHRLAPEGAAQAALVVSTIRTAHLIGRVTDASTGQPLAEASVRVRATGQETLTDLNGEFVLPEVPPGPHTLEVDHLLYGLQAERLDIAAGSTLSLDVSLAVDAIELDPLTVTVDARRMPGERGFRARREAGHGFFMTDEQIVRVQALRMSDVFNSVPGLTVACGQPSVLGSGCQIGFERARSLGSGGRPCPVQYFVDGSAASQEMVETLRPESLVGVEVYNGLSEVPPEYRRGPDTRCGVIAVWLKAR